MKICGITNLEDARLAIELGADLLGFNFYPPSPRFISPQVCEKILAELEKDGLSTVNVGVFVNASVQEIRLIQDGCGLDLAQFSGNEPPEIMAEFGAKAFKALRPRSLEDGKEQASMYANQKCTPALLVDGHQAGAYGGTGKTADWEVSRLLARQYPILLAGGLNPGNVSKALDEVHPWGVDVASGVERVPGKKDPELVRDFILAVKNFDQEVVL